MATNLFKNSDFRSTYINTSHNTTLFTNRVPTGWATYIGEIPNPLTSYHAYIDIDTFDFPVCVFNESNGSRNWKALYMGSGSFPVGVLSDKLPNGPTTFWLSFDAYVTGSGAKLFGGFHYKQEAGGNNAFHSGQFNVKAPDLEGCIGQWKRISVQVPFNWDFYSLNCFPIYGYGFSANVILYIKNVKLEISESPTEWTPHREDNLTPEWLAAHSYTPPIIARDNLSLSRVNDGTNGVSVTSIKAKYLTTSAGSGVTTSTSGWADTPTATTTTNKYLWTYEIITYSNSTTANLTPRIISTHGATGTTGATGRGITSITVEFYSSTSKTTQTGGSWSTTCPLWSAGHYLWKRNKIVYENPTSTVYTTAEVDSSWEAINKIQIGGTNLVLGSDRPYENNSYLVHQYLLSEDLVIGQKYTIRIWGELGSNKDYFGLWFNGPSNGQGFLTDNGDGTYSLKFTASGTINDENLRKISIYAYPSSVSATSRIDRIMFEKGTVCTDYSPSPQDKANQAIIDAWTSEAIIDEAGTQINGGYIQTNTISTKHLVVDDIFASGSAVMNIINAQTVNAERITSGTIDVKRISLYEMSVKSSANSNIETFAVSKDGEVTIRGDIESYSYNPGTAGWSIHKDGSAEFNNVTVRGDLITDNGGISKDSANGNIPAVTIWAGDTYENRKSAPFIVYSDGTMKATKGEFSGVFTGNVEIGNIKIADPSSTSGRDALLTIQDGSNGVYRVKLTDLDTSTFAQNIEVTDTLNQLKTGMRMDGTVYAASSVNVGENTQLTSDLLEINNVTMKSESGKFIFEDVVEFGRTEKHSSVKLYGDLNVTDEFQIGKTIKIGSIATIKVVANGFDIDFIES